MESLKLKIVMVRVYRLQLVIPGIFQITFKGPTHLDKVAYDLVRAVNSPESYPVKAVVSWFVHSLSGHVWRIY